MIRFIFQHKDPFFTVNLNRTLFLKKRARPKGTIILIKLSFISIFIGQVLIREGYFKYSATEFQPFTGQRLITREIIYRKNLQCSKCQSSLNNVESCDENNGSGSFV